MGTGGFAFVGWLVALFAVALLLPSVAPLPPAVAPVVPAGWREGPLAAAREALDLPASSFAAVGREALDFVEAARAAPDRPGDLLEALGPLVAAHDATVRSAFPGYERTASFAPDLARAARVVRSLDALQGDPAGWTEGAWLVGQWREGPAAAASDPGLGALALAGPSAPEAALPPMQSFGDLPTAVEALLAWHGRPLGASDREAIATLSDLPDDVEAALARIVAAHLLQAEATRAAFAQHPADLPLLVAARSAAAGVVLDALTVLRAPLPLPGLLLCGPAGGGVDFDFAGVDSVHTCDVDLLVDLRGNDLYRNNAGGADPSWSVAAMALDLSGDDRYLGARDGPFGFNGGGSSASGFLLDAAGNDVYDAAILIGDGAVNGGVASGAGLLWDEAGDDTYAGRVAGNGGVNGGAWSLGSGLLVDRGGDDTYRGDVTDGGVNGGAADDFGFGTLVDHGGRDTYAGEGRGLAGINGGVNADSSGLVLDLGGDDAYDGTVAHGGVNGGASSGTGLLVDLAGSDRYAGVVTVQGGINGGASPFGSAVLVDYAGDDAYSGAGELSGVNGASYGGSSFLVDMAGDDTYDGAVTKGGVNGAATTGWGALMDGGGNNTFRGTVRVLGGTNGAGTGFAPLPEEPKGGGLGILLTGPGDDTFEATGLTQAAGSIYGAGFLVDRGGTNRYTAGPGSLGQAGARNFATAVLVDLGERADFHLQDGAIGQGAGVQGLGLLVRGGGTTTYDAAASAQPSLSRGAGAALRLDLGEMTLVRSLGSGCPGVQLAETTLPGAEPLTRPPARLVLCAPSEASREPIIDPVTMQPLGPVPKPGVSCGGAVVDYGALHVPIGADLCPGPLDWPAALDEVLGPAASPWLEDTSAGPTTSGGVTLVYAEVSQDVPAALNLAYTPQTVDETCDIMCWAFERAFA